MLEIVSVVGDVAVEEGAVVLELLLPQPALQDASKRHAKTVATFRPVLMGERCGRGSSPDWWGSPHRKLEHSPRWWPCWWRSEGSARPACRETDRECAPCPWGFRRPVRGSP